MYFVLLFFFFKQKTAYEVRISDWSSDVCSSDLIADISGAMLLPDSLEQLKKLDLESLPAVEGSPRLGPCAGGVGKFIAIGLNYADHAAEAGVEVPKEPVIFMKATSCICGPNDTVVIPRGSQKCDWEVELACVIGKPGKYIDEADALQHVAGYCIVNDVSERGFQLEGTGQWVKGKRSEEHTSELQSLMRSSYAVFCLKNKKYTTTDK